jgi:hypothetical protein
MVDDAFDDVDAQQIVIICDRFVTLVSPLFF